MVTHISPQKRMGACGLGIRTDIQVWLIFFETTLKKKKAGVDFSFGLNFALQCLGSKL